MILGLMQTTPLLVSGILRYAASAHGGREVVSHLIDRSGATTMKAWPGAPPRRPTP